MCEFRVHVSSRAWNAGQTSRLSSVRGNVKAGPGCFWIMWLFPGQGSRFVEADFHRSRSVYRSAIRFIMQSLRSTSSGQYEPWRPVRQLTGQNALALYTITSVWYKNWHVWTGVTHVLEDWYESWYESQTIQNFVPTRKFATALRAQIDLRVWRQLYFKSRQRSEKTAARVSSVGPDSSSLIMLVDEFQIQSDNVVRSEAEILSTYDYQTSSIERSPEGTWTVKPSKTEVQFRTQTKVPKLG